MEDFITKRTKYFVVVTIYYSNCACFMLVRSLLPGTLFTRTYYIPLPDWCCGRGAGGLYPPSGPPRPHGRATSPPHSSRRCPQRKNGGAFQHGERGALKGFLRGRPARYPRRGRISWKVEVSSVTVGVFSRFFETPPLRMSI